MKIKQITVTLGRTLNLGNYESARMDVGVTVDLDPDDNPSEVFEATYKTAKEKLNSKIETLVP